MPKYNVRVQYQAELEFEFDPEDKETLEDHDFPEDFKNYTPDELKDWLLETLAGDPEAFGEITIDADPIELTLTPKK